MRTEGQIRHKFKQAKFRHYQRRAKVAFKRVPCNCKFNRSFVSDNGKTVGVCNYATMCEVTQAALGMSWQVVICDDDMPEGKAQAKICPMFQPDQSTQDIKDGIDEILEDQPLNIVAEHFPDLVALLWALGEENEVNEWLTGADSWVEIHQPLSSPNGNNHVVQHPNPVPENNIPVVVEDSVVGSETLALGNDDSQVGVFSVDGVAGKGS